MRRTVTEQLRTNSAVKALVEPVIALVAELEHVPVRAEVVLPAAVRAPGIVPAVARALAIAQAAELVLVIALAAALVLAIVPGVVPVLAIVRGLVALVLAIVLAEVREPETVQAVAEPEHDQVVGVAARLRTRSVIAARRPGQVPLLAAEEDLAAVVAEITHGPAATEAAKAWAAAE
jgi:hypothetical protein